MSNNDRNVEETTFISLGGGLDEEALKAYFAGLNLPPVKFIIIDVQPDSNVFTAGMMEYALELDLIGHHERWHRDAYLAPRYNPAPAPTEEWLIGEALFADHTLGAPRATGSTTDGGAITERYTDSFELLGNPDGYKGYEGAGGKSLLDAPLDGRKRPVILIDETEPRTKK